MPKIEEILHYEAEKQSNEVVLFLEGKPIQNAFEAFSVLLQNEQRLSLYFR